MVYSDEQLIKKFIETIPAKPAKTKKLFAIGFVGLVGSGKSYVAQIISQKLNLYIASNDKIRRFLNDLGFEGANPIQKTLQKIAESSSLYLYKNKISHILDNDLIEFHELAAKNANDFGAYFYIIHITCPEEIILNRIQERTTKIQSNSLLNLSRAGENRYFERKNLHSNLPHPDFFYTIDTSRNVNEQVEELIIKLRNDGAI